MLGALLLVGCHETPLPATPPPTFVKAQAATSLRASRVQWSRGEALAYQVRWRGIVVGTARLGVLGDADGLRVESRFKTVGMANEVHPVQHRLVTRLDRPNREIDDLHTALGRLRSWARAGAAPARLTLRHRNHNYTLELAQPVLESSDSQPRLRIEGRARGDGAIIDLTIWLSADVKHTPLLVTLVHKGQQVHATLLPSDS